MYLYFLTFIIGIISFYVIKHTKEEDWYMEYDYDIEELVIHNLEIFRVYYKRNYLCQYNNRKV